MNQLIIRLARKAMWPAGDARVTVSGFAPARLHARNAYMEWLLPPGQYAVFIEADGDSRVLSYQLGSGENVELHLHLPAPKWWLRLCWAALLLLSGLLLAAALWWELTHHYYLAAAGTVLLAGACILYFGVARRSLALQVTNGAMHA